MLSILAPFALTAAAIPAAQDISAKGPLAPLKGSYQPAASPKTPVVLIIPGSGPTDRDGNNPMGVRAATYRLLAEALAVQNIASVRIDKRGMFGSAGAVANANAVTMADYAHDTAAWIAAMRAKTGVKCVWLLGHSEGALIALASAENSGADICGYVLVAGPGRKLGDVLREQLRANPANAPIIAPAESILTQLESGKRVDEREIPPPLLPLFRPDVQGFLISILALEPAKLIGKIDKPVLIMQGDADIQVSVKDAEALKLGQPKAVLSILAGVNHVLKTAPKDDRAANFATYLDADLPLANGVGAAIAGFIAGK